MPTWLPYVIVFLIVDAIVMIFFLRNFWRRKNGRPSGMKSESYTHLRGTLIVRGVYDSTADPGAVIIDGELAAPGRGPVQVRHETRAPRRPSVGDVLRVEFERDDPARITVDWR